MSKRGLFRRKSSSDEPNVDELLPDIDELLPEIAARQPEKKGRRNLFGRRKQASDVNTDEFPDLGLEDDEQSTRVQLQEKENVKSILAADFGSVYTRVVLVDAVEGVYRMVSRGETRTTDGFPVSDLSVGFDRVLRDMTESTGRQFLQDTGHIIMPERSDRSGVDAFVLTASIGRPLRAVVIGLIADVSIASALRAAAGTYIEVAATISLDDGRTVEDRLNTVVLAYPDVILIAGGTEGGAEAAILELSDIAYMAIQAIPESKRPIIVYSGNYQLIERVKAIFEELTTVLIAGNVRPSLDVESVDSARLQLGKAFDRHGEVRNESFALISSMSDTGILPTAQSYTLLADYFGKAYPGRTALVDMGSSTSTMAIATAEGTINSIRTDLGLGHSATQALAIIGIDGIRQWLPFNITGVELRNYALNKTLRPASAPMNTRELYIEHAFLRAGIRIMMAESNPAWVNERLPIARLIGAGAALTKTGHFAYDALLLIDAIQPSGATQLYSDGYGIVAALGAIAPISPKAVIQLLDTSSSITPLGTCISADGLPKQDKAAMEITITTDDEIIEDTLMGGHLMVFPLGIGKTAEVAIKCSSGASVNGKRSVKLTVTGGLVGLIFDARGRPLPLMLNAAERAARFPLWVHEMTGDPIIAIDEAWLEEVEEPEIDAEKGKAEKKRGSRRSGKSKKQGGKKAAEEDLMSGFDDFLDDSLEDDDDDEIDELRNVLS